MRRRLLRGWLLLLLGALHAERNRAERAGEGDACAAEGAEGSDGWREGRTPSVPPRLGNLVRYAQSVEHATAAEGTLACRGVGCPPSASRSVRWQWLGYCWLGQIDVSVRRASFGYAVGWRKLEACGGQDFPAPGWLGVTSTLGRAPDIGRHEHMTDTRCKVLPAPHAAPS
jgi:hypothetical protein